MEHGTKYIPLGYKSHVNHWWRSHFQYEIRNGRHQTLKSENLGESRQLGSPGRVSRKWNVVFLPDKKRRPWCWFAEKVTSHPAIPKSIVVYIAEAKTYLYWRFIFLPCTKFYYCLEIFIFQIAVVLLFSSFWLNVPSLLFFMKRRGFSFQCRITVWKIVLEWHLYLFRGNIFFVS